MNTKDILQSAINQSINQNEIIDVDIDDLNEARRILSQIWDGEIDSTEVSPDLIRDDSIETIVDIWGWDDSTPENEQEWRLYLRLLND